MIGFNLLPHRARSQQQRQRQFYALLLSVILLATLLSAIGLALIRQRQQTQQARNDWLHNAHRQLDAEGQRNSALQQDIAVLQARAERIAQRQRHIGRTAQLLRTLAAQLSPGMYLQTLNLQALHVTLNGYAASQQLVGELLQKLRSQPDLIHSARLIETRAADSQLQFSLALELAP